MWNIILNYLLECIFMLFKISNFCLISYFQCFEDFSSFIYIMYVHLITDLVD